MSKVSNYDTAAAPITDGSFLYVAFKVSPTLFASRKVAIETLLAQINAAHEAKDNPHPQYQTGGNKDTHSPRSDNPHGTTAAQVGADPSGSAAAAKTAAEATAAAADEAHVVAPDPHAQYSKRAVDWFLIDDDITLDNTHIGKTGDVTAASVISLPTLAAASAGFAVELIPASSPLAITLLPDGSDPVKDDLTVITGPAVVAKNRAGTSWIVLGAAEAP